MSSKLQPGVGYTLTSDARCQSLQITQPGRRRHPLEVYSNPDNGSPAVSIWPGSVNGLIPQVSGSYLDAANRPKLTITSSGYVYVKATRASGSPFPATVEILFAATVPTDTLNLGHFALASITKTNNSLQISQLVRSSLVTGRAATYTTAVWYWFNV